MTDVGKISLGVEINADELNEKLGEAVRKAVLPALAEIQRELNKLQREYDATARSAEKSSTAQVAGAKAVSEALNKVTRSATEAAAATSAAGEAEQRSATGATRAVRGYVEEVDKAIRKQLEWAAVGTATNEETEREIKRITRAWQEQTAAITANTVARIANASTPINGPPNRAGPGRGAYDRSSGGGRRGGLLGFLTGPVGLNTIALGVQGVPAALTAITALIGATQQLGQAAIILPGLWGAVGASLGTAVLGVHGMKDAITALNKAAGPDANAADLKKAADGLKGMSDSGKSLATEISKLMQGPWKDLQKGIQQRMFVGVDKDLDQLSKKALPGVGDGMGKIADAWNKTIKTTLGSIGADKNLSLIDRLLGNTATGQSNATKAIDPLIHSLATLASTGSEFLPRLGNSLAKVADRFDDFVSKAGRSGQLWKWIDEGLNGLRALGNSLLNIGKTITGLTKAEGGDRGFLGWLEDATKRMQVFVNSTDGQHKLHDFFQMGRDGMHQWADLFKELLPAILKIAEGFAAWGQVTLPIVTALASLVNWLGKVPGLVQGATVAFLAWRTATGLGGLLGKAGLDFSVGGGFGLGGSGGGGGSSATNSLLGQTGRTTADKDRGAALSRIALGLGLAAFGTTTQQSGGTNLVSQIGGGLGTVGGLTLAGAGIGSIFPGPGTAIGAGAGAAAGIGLAAYNALVGADAEAAKKAADAHALWAQQLATASAAMQQTSEAIKDLNDGLLASKGAIDPTAIAAISTEIAAIPDKLKSSFTPDQVKGVEGALKGLNENAEQLAATVSGSQSGFDALTARLEAMGPNGHIAAQELANVRSGILQAQEAGQQAGPALQALADAMGTSVPNAAAQMNNALHGLPTSVPINVSMPGGADLVKMLQDLHQGITTLPDGTVKITSPLGQQVLDMLATMHVKITELPDKSLAITVDGAQYQDTVNKLGLLGQMLAQLHGQSLNIPVPAPTPNAPGPGQGDHPITDQLPPPRYMGGIVRGFAEGGWNPGIGPGTPTDPGTMNHDMWPQWWKDIQNNNDPTVDYPWLFDPKWQPGINFNNYPAFGAGRAGGGSFMLPGYSPGVDNMMVPLSGGEGIIIPEAMRALGPDWLYNLNSKFRSGLNRAGYAAGGVFGYDDGGVPTDDASVLGVLRQIRDLLAGRGGVTSNPLAATAASTNQIAKGIGPGLPGAAAGAGGVKLGPFGTPIKPRNRAYEAAAAAIQALGGNPETWLGQNPADFGVSGIVPPGGLSALAGPAFNAGSFAGPLAEFARTGVLTPQLRAMGLDANDPVISAIINARDRKKGGLGGDAIGSLVQQVLGGGGYTGALDDSNSALVRALEQFRQKGGSQVGVPGGRGVPGLAPYGAAAGSPAAFGGATFGSGTPGSAESLIAFAQATGAGGGKYAAASDLAGGLADCSGAVSDLVELLTKGQASPDRLFSTHNEEQVLQSLGAVPGLIPGSLQIGFNDAHTAATLPNGVPFESGGSGGGPRYGGSAQGANQAQFTKFYSLPTDWTGQVPGGLPGTPAGMAHYGGATPGLSGFGGGVVPVYVTNWGGGAPGGPGGPGGPLGGIGQIPGVSQVGQAGVTAAGQAAAGVSTDVLKATAASVIPVLAGRQPTPTGDATLAGLVRQGNPLALAKAAGFDVPSFQRAGGFAGGNFQTNTGPGFDATGRIFSDTGALSDRTTTDLAGQIDAMRAQLVSVGQQTVTKLSDKFLTPVVSAGVTSGFQAVNASTFNQQGTALGNTAGPIIATAVARSIPSSSGGSPVTDALGVPTGGSTLPTLGNVVDGATSNLFAGGGLVSGGIPGKDSVPILAQMNEWILNTDDVAKLGGTKGVAQFVGALRSGKLRKLASGGSAQGSGPPPGSVTNTLGADFFGVSQVPIIGTIINLLISVLLKVIGVNIDVRNTLNNLTNDFRGFRGEAFKAFDAQGRLINDTSALVDRSSTSEQTAADERVRILKIVIDALVKYIIEKVIVPIAKAVANAAIQAGGAAAGAAINSQAPGAGSIVSAFIDSAGQAGVDIASQVLTDLSEAIISTGVSVVGDALQSLLPDLTTQLFGGKLIEMITTPIGNLIQNLFGGFLGTIMTLFSGLFGGASTLIPGLPFDEGGLASGVGFLPKAVSADELVLSPKETTIFSKFTDALARGGFGNNRTVHAPITVMQAGPETAQQVQDRLLRYV